LQSVGFSWIDLDLPLCAAISEGEKWGGRLDSLGLGWMRRLDRVFFGGKADGLIWVGPTGLGKNEVRITEPVARAFSASVFDFLFTLSPSF
jgi:hypothetical protein